MNIMMLGHSGVGKTTYMASMFGSLQTAINGFTVTAASSEEGIELRELSKAIQRGMYPPPTAVRATYNLQLCYQGSPCFDFTWTDYRGGVLRERSSSDDKAQLLSALGAADGVLIFVDSCAGDSPRTHHDVATMMNLLSRAVVGISKKMPIAIVFTKSDLVDELSDRLAKTVTGLCEAIAASQNLAGTIIPIACGPNPQLVELPILYMLRTGIVARHNELVDKVNAAIERRNQHVGRVNVFNEFWGWATGEITHSDRARWAEEEAEKAYGTLKPLVEPADGLISYLEPLKMF